MFGSRDRVIRMHLRQRFVFTLKTGDAFEGLLLDADARVLVVGDAQAHTADGPARVDGQLFLERDDVAYMQLPAPAAVVGELVR